MQQDKNEELMKHFDSFIDLLDRNSLNLTEEWSKIRPLLASPLPDYFKIDQELSKFEKTMSNKHISSFSQGDLSETMPKMNSKNMVRDLLLQSIANNGHFRPTNSSNSSQIKESKLLHDISKLQSMSADVDVVLSTSQSRGVKVGNHIDAIEQRNEQRVILDNIKIRNGLLMEF